MNVIQFVDGEFLSRVFLGATLYDWLILIGIWAGSSAGLILLHRIILWRFSKLSKRTTNQIDDFLVELVKKTKSISLVALGLFIALVSWDMPDRAVFWLERLVFIVLMLQVVWWGNALIKLSIDNYRQRKLETDASAVTTVQAIGVLGRITLWVIIILLILDNFGIEIAPLIAGLGIGGVAVALAVQNILGDLFASLSIVLDKPFVVGDFLIVDEYLGTVEYIGLKTTRLRSLSGEQIVFSNSDLLKSRIRNYKRMFERRVVFTVGVTYQTTYDQLAEIPKILREIVTSQDKIRFDRAHFKEYSDSSLVYEVVYYVLSSDFNIYMDIQQAINLEIYRRFSDAGIIFAYPTRTVHIDSVPGEMVSKSVKGNGEA